MAAGLYIGAQGAYSLSDASSSSVTQEERIASGCAAKACKKKGLGMRLAVGYNFNSYLSLEGGFAAYRALPVNFSITKLTSAGGQDKTLSLNGSYSLDLLAKVSTPSVAHFYLYAKSGLAYVRTGINSVTCRALGHLTRARIKRAIQAGGLLVAQSDNQNFFRPKAVLGLAYKLTKNVTADVSYARIIAIGSQSERSFFPSLSIASVGLAYTF